MASPIAGPCSRLVDDALGRGLVLTLACALAACHETAPPRLDPVAPTASVIAGSGASASSTPTSSASTTGPSSTWIASPAQPTTQTELHAFTGHWKVTGSPLALFAYQDGIILKFEVEADTASYRKGEIRFELDMAMNGTGFTVHDHGRPDPGAKVYGDDGLDRCTHVVSQTPLYSSLEARVVDPDTLRVQRPVWTATFVTGADGTIVRCEDARWSDEKFDELRRAK